MPVSILASSDEPATRRVCPTDLALGADDAVSARKAGGVRLNSRGGDFDASKRGEREFQNKPEESKHGEEHTRTQVDATEGIPLISKAVGVLASHRPTARRHGVLPGKGTDLASPFVVNPRGKEHPISKMLTVSKGFDRLSPPTEG